MPVSADSARNDDTFYETFYPRLVSVVFLRTGDWEAAEDAAQEAFVRFFAGAARDGVEQPEAWLYATARNYATSLWRRHRRNRTDGAATEQIPLGGPSPEHGVEERLDVAKALLELPAGSREALILHYLLDLPVAAAAQRCGITEGAMRVRLSRARKQLRDIVETP